MDVAVDRIAGSEDSREMESAPMVMLGLWLAITTAWWWLALAPIEGAPDWLAAARSVCFGSTPSGLPDTYGWLLLTAAPGTMLVAMLTVWHRDLALGVKTMWQGKAGKLGLVAIGALTAAAVSWAGLRVAEGLAIANTSYDPTEMGALPDNYPRLGTPVPAFALLDQAGAAFTPETLKGRVTLFTFAFAHCHTMCPVIVQQVRSALERMGDDSPQVAILTLDPWRDTPSRLAQMHTDWKMPEHVRVLSGDVAAVEATLDGFNVPRTRDEATGEVSHPALVYLVGPDGRIAYAFNNPTVDWLVEASARLKSADSSPLVAR